MTTGYTSTESTAGGTMLYIANTLVYKPRHDLEIHETNGHLFINQDKFSKYYLATLQEKLAIENKSVFLLGGFLRQFIEL